MLSYRHAYHAGNHADVLKHLCLLALLERLTLKPKPLCYFETHAGAGRYRGDSAAADKTGEHAEGAGPLSTPQLRTGAWTRFGGERTLGDPVTEDVLSALAETTRTAARAQGYATGWAEGRREAAAEGAAHRAELEAVTREAEARRQAEHEQALVALVECTAYVRRSTRRARVACASSPS